MNRGGQFISSGVTGPFGSTTYRYIGAYIGGDGLPFFNSFIVSSGLVVLDGVGNSVKYVGGVINGPFLSCVLFMAYACSRLVRTMINMRLRGIPRGERSTSFGR